MSFLMQSTFISSLLTLLHTPTTLGMEVFQHTFPDAALAPHPVMSSGGVVPVYSEELAYVKILVAP